MLINAELSTDTSLAARQNLRTGAGAAASQTNSAATNDSAASQLDPSLQRLTDAPSLTQEDGFEIQDETSASQTLDFLRQNMMAQPGMAMAAQGHQWSQSVLSLLPPIN